MPKAVGRETGVSTLVLVLIWSWVKGSAFLSTVPRSRSRSEAFAQLTTLTVAHLNTESATCQEAAISTAHIPRCEVLVLCRPYLRTSWRPSQ